ncbi:hypothetical protein IPN35_03255 [Candidatus Peregrinibacteria bacterium]|nr:MAG: hypothetical protein IPN35_03255 [Candidatus Peregrinibacteria bacterium]
MAVVKNTAATTLDVLPTISVANTHVSTGPSDASFASYEITAGNRAIVGEFFADGSGLFNSGTPDLYFRVSTNHPILFGTNGTERVRISESGKVGIGTTSPTEKLDVNGNINFTGELNINSVPGTSGQVLTSGGDGSAPTWVDASTVGTTDHGALTGLTDDDHTQYALLAGRSGGQSLTGGTGVTDKLVLQGTSANGTSTAKALEVNVGNNGGTNALTVLNSGNVGIGNTFPTDKLDVNGNMNFSGAGNIIRFSGTNGGGEEGISYTDTEGNPRYAMHFPGSNEVALSSRGPDGTVTIAANTSTVGSAGEVKMAVFEDDKIQLAPNGGNIGIGTASPTDKLDVNGNMNFSGAGNIIRFSGTNGGGEEGISYTDTEGNPRYAMHFPGSNEVALSSRGPDGTVTIGANTSTVGSAGEVKMAVFEDDKIQLAPNGGKVGIGTTSPEAKFHVSTPNSLEPNGILEIASNDNTGANLSFLKSRGSLGSKAQVNTGDRLGGLYFKGYTNGGTYSGNVVAIQGVAAQNFTSSAQGSYITLETTSIGNTSRQERMRIDSSGNVGIGTTSPTEKLDVNGNINFTGELNINSVPGTSGQVLTSGGDGSAPTWETLPTGTDDQTLDLTGNTLSIEDGNSVDLSSYLDNTDDQTLSEILGTSTDAGGNAITNLASPSSGSDAATKTYVDNLINGLTWKAPVDDADGPDGGTPDDDLGGLLCNSTNESFATYNKGDSLIYVCNGTNWVEMSSTVGLPDLNGDITGSITSNVIADDIIDEANLKVTNSANDNYLLTFDNATGGFTWIDPTTVGSTSFIALSDTPNSFTAGSVLFTSNSAVAEDNSNFFWDDTEDRLGIGTASPNAKLHIKTDTGTNSEIDIQSGAENHWGIYQDETTADLRFWNTDDRLTITDDGNVGIGIVNPTSTLQINGSFAVLRSEVTASTSSSGETIIGVTDTAAPRTITLSNADATSGRIMIIKDESGGAATNNITVVVEGGGTMDGATSIVISANYGVLRLYSNGTNWFSF